MKRAWEKCEAFLEKYQMWILTTELLGVIFATAYICRNVAVDWDEAYSLRMMIKFSLKEMIEVTAADIHPPLYYLLLRGFCALFGTEIFALKLFSVLFTGLTMLLGMTYVRKNWGFKVALVWNLVVGLGPQFLFYSVNIRMYSMSLFFVTWSMLLAYEILQDNRPLDWVLFVLSGLGGVYTHYFTAVPLALIYGYLLIGLLLFRRKSCKFFVLSCVVTVLGYLPWLSVMMQSFERMGASGTIDFKTIDFSQLWEWAFSTNIELSKYMPLVLFGFGIVIFAFGWKRFSGQERLFLIMCGLNFPISYLGCRLIASMNEHFWDNRYVFAALGFFWLFLSIVYVKSARVNFYTYSIWIAIICASSFMIMRGKELGTVAYMENTYKVLEPVRNEKYVIYDYNTFHVLYGAHLREQEFIFFDEVDFDELDKDYVYFISWTGRQFDPEVKEKYQIDMEPCGTMQFENGYANMQLYKINFKKER